MKVYYSIKDVRRMPRGSIVAVGIFDGLHRGHLRMIKALTSRAKRLNRNSLILTFYPHPSSILHPKSPVPLLTSLQHRLRLLKMLGVNVTVLVKFTEAFSRMKPETFIKDYLLNRLNMKEIFIGANFTFGRQGSGDISLLRKLAKRYSFNIHKIAMLKINKRSISSTYIRRLIMKGRLDKAGLLLGRPVSILGTVKKGRKRGRILGYPTANIDPHHEAIPPSGVYIAHIKLEGRYYDGLVNIGYRPTFYSAHSRSYPLEPTIEAHLFNFNRDIYKKDLEIIFLKKLRPEKRFKSRESLKERIIQDERAAKRFLRVS